MSVLILGGGGIKWFEIYSHTQPEDGRDGELRSSERDRKSDEEDEDERHT